MNNMDPQQQYEYLFPRQQMPYASFWRRLGASMFDGIVVITVNLGIAYFWDGSIIETSFASNVAGWIVSWLYSAIQESSTAQATLGKRLAKIKVTDVAGNRISFGRATARHFSKYLSMIILFIGYLMMLWDDRKQTLHDKIADALVLKP